MHKVFVYGTLRKHESNHHLLSDSKFLGQAVSLRKGVMLNTVDHPHSGFPFMVEEAEAVSPLDFYAGVFSGQIFEVDDATLGRLDRLEGHPNWYHRSLEQFVLNGDVVDAYMYWMPFDNLPIQNKFNVVPIRDWSAWIGNTIVVRTTKNQ